MSSSEKKCFRTELARENTVPGKTGNERKHGQLAPYGYIDLAYSMQEQYRKRGNGT